MILSIVGLVMSLKCLKFGKAASTSYTKHKCRCDVCKLWCRNYKRGHSTKYYQDNETYRAKRKKYNAARWANKDIREKQQKYIWEYNLKKNYNLSIAEYDTMLSNQNGRCVLCEELPNGRRLSVDHNHETGKIRGLLCIRCNTRLHKNTDLNWFGRAADYLERERL